MDLLALLTNDNRLELIRISYRAQKVFEIEEKETITSIMFSPDCIIELLLSLLVSVWVHGRLHKNAQNLERRKSACEREVPPVISRHNKLGALP
jgi:hypothetical protein